MRGRCNARLDPGITRGEGGQVRGTPWIEKRCVLKFGGVAAEPPAGVVAAVGEEGSCAGLVGGALLVGLDAVVLERREQELAYLHGIVTAAVPYADAPDGPVADP
jgi:hypothetical protein